MTKRSMLPSSMHTPWAESKSYNLSELNTIQGGVASPCLSSSLPFCVRFNRALPLEIQPYSQAATLDTKPLAKSYLGGNHSHLPSNHFQYARACHCYVILIGSTLSNHGVRIGIHHCHPDGYPPDWALIWLFEISALTNSSDDSR